MITKDLKNHTFTYDPETREFGIYEVSENHTKGKIFGHNIHLRFVQMFSLVRFFISVSQKGFWRKRIRKAVNEHEG